MAYKMAFGKYEEKTLEWVFFNDPGYIWWMLNNGSEENHQGPARARFDTLVRRAQHPLRSQEIAPTAASPFRE